MSVSDDIAELASEVFDHHSLRDEIPTLAPGTSGDLTKNGRDYLDYFGLNFSASFSGLSHHFGQFASGDFLIAGHVFQMENATRTAWIYHGYFDHSGLFRHAIEYGLRRNWSVVIYDLPGHGLSTGRKASIDSFQSYVRVMKDALAVVDAFDLPTKRIAIGQSTGAAALMTYLLQGGNAFEQTVLLAPLLRPARWRKDFFWHGVLKRFVKRIPRRWSISSGDPEFLRLVKDKDPMQWRYLPLRWVTAMKLWQQRFLTLPESSAKPLIIQGDIDATVDFEWNLPRIQSKFPDATVRMIPNAGHHLVNETEDIREQIWAAIDDFISVSEAHKTETL